MENGIVYTYRGSWCAQGVETTWECDWRAIGNRGSITWNGADGFNAQLSADNDDVDSVCDFQVTEATPEETSAEAGHAALIRDFVRCIRQGTTPETVGSDNIKSLAMVFGAIESAEKMAPVSIQY